MAKFISPYKNLRITMESDEIELVKGRVHIMPGKHIEFDNGEYTTEDKKEIEFLRKYAETPANKVFEEGGVKEEVAEPEEVKVEPEEVKKVFQKKPTRKTK